MIPVTPERSGGPEDFGVIVGNKGLLRVTSDGGKSWRERDSKTNLELTSVSIGDDSTAVAVGANGTEKEGQQRGNGFAAKCHVGGTSARSRRW